MDASRGRQERNNNFHEQHGFHIMCKGEVLSAAFIGSGQMFGLRLVDSQSLGYVMKGCVAGDERQGLKFGLDAAKYESLLRLCEPK